MGSELLGRLCWGSFRQTQVKLVGRVEVEGATINTKSNFENGGES